MRKLIVPLLLSTVLVSACSQKPASFEAYGVNKGAGTRGIHTVLAGDTVYTIAQNYQLPMREIITLNNIDAPYVLNTGYRMKLPPPNEHVVRKFDSIFTISKMYEVSSNRLVELNDLKPPYNLRTGQVLRLPTPTLKQKAVMKENLARQERAAPTQKTARMGSIEREDLEDKSARPSSTGTPNVKTQEQPKVQQSRKESDDTRGAKKAVVVPSKKPTSNTQTSKPAVQKASTTTRAKIPSSTPALSGKGQYMRPVSGRVISSFGPKSDGLHNDGINIKAGRGTPVRAAENGVVVYAGNDLEGYGNLILIRHRGKMMTAYAHLDKMLIERGATVDRGQSIGTVGSTGQVDTPQLHFEVRKGSTPINPDKYL